MANFLNQKVGDPRKVVLVGITVRSKLGCTV